MDNEEDNIVIASVRIEDYPEEIQEKPKIKSKKNTNEVKTQIDDLLNELRNNIMGKGNGSKQIKELKRLAKQTTIKKEINNAMDFIVTAHRRRWYQQIYDRITQLRGLVKSL